MFNSSHTGKQSSGGSAVVPVGSYPNELALRILANKFVGQNNNVILDSSNNNFAFTLLSPTVTLTTQGRFSPFSPNGYSAMFDGANDYFTSPGSDAFRFGTGDFTVEFFMRPTNWGANGQGIAGLKADEASTGWVIYNNGSSTKLHVRIGGSGVGSDFVSTADVDKGIWQHWALVRSNGSLRWYKNGVQCGSSTLPVHLGDITDTTGLFTIGHTQTWTGNSKFRGNISNLHVVKKALYNADFTPPKKDIVAVTETTFLAFNKAVFKDISANKAPLTILGWPDACNFGPNVLEEYNESVHSGGYSFGTATGTTQPISFVGGTALRSIASTSFTIEGFMKIHSKAAQIYILRLDNDSATGELAYELFLDTTGNLNLRVSYRLVSVINTVTSTPYTYFNQYVHFAIVKSGTNFRLYLDGKLKFTLAVPGFRPLLNPSTASQIGNGGRLEMSNIRIVKDIELYTADFEPPIQELAKLPNTVLLLLGRNANIIDDTNHSNIQTKGDVRIEQTMVKEGLGSIYFDGTGDFLRVFNTSNNNGANRNSAMAIVGLNFRLSGWAYPIGASSTTRKTIFSTKATVSEVAGNLALYIENGLIRLSYNGTAMNTGFTAPRDAWFHWALVRVAGSLSLYVNGAWSGVLNAAAVTDISALFLLGANDNGSEPFYGYMDKIEMEVGKSSVVNTFLAPSKAFAEKTSSDDLQYKYNVLQLGVNGSVGDKTLSNKTIGSKVDIYSKESASLQGASDAIQTANYGPFSRSKSALLCTKTIGGVSFSPKSIENLFFGKKITIEAWIFPIGYHGASAYTGIIFSNRDATSNAGQLEFGYYGAQYSGSYQLGLYSGKSNTVVKSNILGKLKEWAHVVVEIDLTTPGTANEVVFFINGVREVVTHDFSTLADGTATHNFSVGKSSANVLTATVGYIEELRLVAGSDYVYDASMTVPTTELTNIPGTMLRIDNKRNNARNEVSPNRYKMSGAIKLNFNRKDITTDVDLSVNYNSAYFSAAFNAVNDTQRNQAYVIITKDSGFYDIGTGDVTIECYYEPAVTTNRILNILDASHDSTIRIGGNATAKYSFEFGTSSLNVGATTNADCSIVVGEMVHLAIVRKNGIVSFHIDGVIYDSKPNTDYIRISKLRLGGNDSVTNSYSNGMFGIAQISSYAKYDGNFITDSSVQSNDANTLFTMKFKNPMVYDTTGNCRILTGPGMTAGLASDITLSSVYNDGTKRSIQTYINNSNQLTIKRPIHVLTNDVSFEFILDGGQTFDIDTGGVNAGFFALSYNGTNLLYYLRVSGTSVWTIDSLAINGSLSNTEPTHICVRKNGDVVTVYVNGIVKHNRTIVSNYEAFISELYVSANAIRDIRITEGIKRYTENVIDV